MSDFTNSWFCSLRGYAATTKEKHDTFYLAAIMPLLDDLTDSLKIPSIDIIKGLKNNNDSLHPSMPAIRYLYNKLLNNCSDSFVKLFHEALKVQDKSILQLENHTLDTAILKQITYEKRGISTFLFRLVLENSLVNPPYSLSAKSFFIVANTLKVSLFSEYEIFTLLGNQIQDLISCKAPTDIFFTGFTLPRSTIAEKSEA